MKRIRKGDEVYVRKGKDRGKRGTVLRVLAGGRVMVEGINLVKRHTRPNPQLGIPGGIVEKEAALAVANVGLLNPATKKADRVGFKTLQDGRKVRVYKSDNEVVDA